MNHCELKTGNNLAFRNGKGLIFLSQVLFNFHVEFESDTMDSKDPNSEWFCKILALDHIHLLRL